ncbi:MAG: hypothetical protein ACOCW9_06550 [Thermodesulfobacteriota bacterium]
MNWIIAGMTAALALPILDFFRSGTIWEKMMAFASVSAKSGVLMLALAVIETDGFIALVGVITLSMGNAGLMFLAYLFERLEIHCD